jgi:hypothetical protein
MRQRRGGVALARMRVVNLSPVAVCWAGLRPTGATTTMERFVLQGKKNMPASSDSIDVQKLVSGAARLELRLLAASVEAMQVYLRQAARFSDLAAETLQDVQEDKATLAETARKVSAFGRDSAQAYSDLAQRLGTRFFDSIDKVAEARPLVRPEPAGTAPARRKRSTARRKA